MEVVTSFVDCLLALVLALGLFAFPFFVLERISRLEKLMKEIDQHLCSILSELDDPPPDEPKESKQLPQPTNVVAIGKVA